MDNAEYRKLRSCTSKIIYLSEKEVDHAIRAMHRFSKQKIQGKPRRYFCDYERDTNPHWHITHSKKRKHNATHR